MQRDSLHRFVFENTPIRGNSVHLNVTLESALQYHEYPPQLRVILGELMVASALLSATLKMEGALILQIQGKGALKLLVVECTAEAEMKLSMRATAKWQGELPIDPKAAIGDGHCVITLAPNNAEQYQGIVPLDGNSIAQILEHYMLRSQQIDTRLWLACDGKSASGMLLQKLPDQPEYDADAWNRICILADTVTNEELQALDPAQLLTRLFGEEDVRMFSAKPTQFFCSCTRTKVANMLLLLGKEEVASILTERDEVEVHCDFCNKRYAFDAVDTAALFAHEPVAPTSKAKH
ncbi:MAG: Hsp33 family molecular chaperone HslO [Methylophilaceae bacterium]